MFNSDLLDKSESIIRIGTEKHWRISTGESCTGGLIAALLTEIPGSSRVVGRCFITYSNRAKREILGVPADTLTQFGAVSAKTVITMAQNLLDTTTAHLTIAVSGIAGPGGGTPDKPTGTVHMASATADGVIHHCHQFGDIGRSAVRMATVNAAADMLLARLQA